LGDAADARLMGLREPLNKPVTGEG
jgi:hypothetical protein